MRNILAISNSFSQKSTRGSSAGRSLSISSHLMFPGQLGNIDSYIQSVNRIPLMSLDEERQYAIEFRDQNNLESARYLILSHLRLVVSISRNYLGYGLSHADLIQEGNIGLMKAVKRFDPTQNVRLVSYAIHWIKAEIHEYILRNWRIVKVATTKAQRKLFFNLRSKRKSLQVMSLDEIDHLARNLNVKREEVEEMEARLFGSDVTLESRIEDNKESFSPITYLTDLNNEPTAVLASRHHDTMQTDGIQQALNVLDIRSRRIIEARWLKVDDSGSGGSTLQDLADELGVSAERIRQIEVSAMKKMRFALDKYI